MLQVFLVDGLIGSSCSQSVVGVASSVIVHQVPFYQYFQQWQTIARATDHEVQLTRANI